MEYINFYINNVSHPFALIQKVALVDDQLKLTDKFQSYDFTMLTS